MSSLTLQRQEVNILTINKSSVKKKQKTKNPNLLKAEAQQSSSLSLHFQNASESYQLRKCTYLVRDGSQSVSQVTQSYPTLFNPNGLKHTRFPCPSPTLRACSNSQNLLIIYQVGDAIQPSHPLSSPSPPALNPSQHQGLFSESVLLIRWPEYWSFSFSISPSNEYSGLISFKTDCFDLLVVQGLSRVFSNTTVPKHQFFDIQLS